MAVPIVNSLTFVWTAVASYALGERARLNLRTSLGSGLILAGVAACVAAKGAEMDAAQLAGELHHGGGGGSGGGAAS